MLSALIEKDLRRVWRNPLPWLLNLALPIAITAIIGLVFGGQGNDNSLGRIRFGVVENDKSAISDLLRGAATQGKAGQFLEPVFLERDEAERQLKDDKLAAILVIPPNFASNYLMGEKVQLELIKNPAQEIHPTVLNELFGVVVSGLNAVSRNLNSEFPKWRAVFEDDSDYHEIARLVDETGSKLHAARGYLFPPLITFTNALVEQSNAAPKLSANAVNAASTTAAAAEPEQKFNLFAYMLVGMAGMFLLSLASQGMIELHGELFNRTFERYCALRQNLLPFIFAKMIFTVVIVYMGAAVIFWGGQVMFHFHWTHPLQLAALTLAYVVFCAGLMSVTVSFMPDERRANTLNNMLSMVLSMAGGCMFPPDNLPAVMRDYVMPLLPTFWFATAGRGLWWPDGGWTAAAAKLAVTGLACAILAAFIFKRRFGKGIR